MRTLIVVASLFGNPTASQAIMMEITPSSQIVDLGFQAQFDVIVSGLGGGVAPSISTYDIDIGFDSSILLLNSTAFGTALDVTGFGTIQIATPGVGSANLFELSFDSPTDLDFFQPDSFTLATLFFDALSLGTSQVSITVNAIGDSLGDQLVVTTQAGSVSVQAAQVPEPSTMVLLAPFLAAAFYRGGLGQRARNA